MFLDNISIFLSLQSVMYYIEALNYMITKPPFNAKYSNYSNYFCKIEKKELVKEGEAG